MNFSNSVYNLADVGPANEINGEAATDETVYENLFELDVE